MNKQLRFYPIVLAFLLTFGTPALCVLFTKFTGEICWPQRLGAVYVGFAVFLQGYISADADRFKRVLSDGNELRMHLNQIGFTIAIFGTLFAAFGDILPASVFYGLRMCPA